MSAPWHMIEEKAEDAMMSALLTEYSGNRDTSSGLVTGGDFNGYRMLPGFSLLDIEPPYIGITAEESEPAEDGLAIPTGNQQITLRLKVVSHHGDGTTRASHSSIAAKLKDFTYASNLVDLLNAAGVTDFTAFYTFPVNTRRMVEDGQIITETAVRIRARPS